MPQVPQQRVFLVDAELGSVFSANGKELLAKGVVGSFSYENSSNYFSKGYIDCLLKYGMCKMLQKIKGKKKILN